MSCTLSTTRPTVLHDLAALLGAEAIKLRRSMLWWFVLALPLLSVVTGTVNYQGNQGVLSPGWGSYTSQVTIFYSLFFFSIGVALVTAALWRPEHKGTSWNAVRTTRHSPLMLVISKTLVALVPVALMQLVLVSLTWVSGTFVLHLGGGLPLSTIVSGALTVVACLPLVVLQSLAAMLMRSFGTPVALGLGGVVVGIGITINAPGAAGLWPYALVTRTLTLGSTALSSAGTLSASEVGGVLLWALLGTLGWGTVLALVTRVTAGVR